MTRYVWDGSHFISKKTGEPMALPHRTELCMPQVIGDIPEYRSPIDGKPITSRSHRKYDLEKNGCVEVDPPAVRRKYRNPSFALKRGLPLADDVAESLRK